MGLGSSAPSPPTQKNAHTKINTHKIQIQTPHAKPARKHTFRNQEVGGLLILKEKVRLEYAVNDTCTPCTGAGGQTQEMCERWDASVPLWARVGAGCAGVWATPVHASP